VLLERQPTCGQDALLQTGAYTQLHKIVFADQLDRQRCSLVTTFKPRTVIELGLFTAWSPEFQIVHNPSEGASRRHGEAKP